MPSFIFGQTTNSQTATTVQSVDLKSFEWLTELTEKGLELTKDSVTITREFQKVLQDENYRATLYPDNYSWEQAIKFIQNKELKKAYWYFINLYPENEENKKLVVKSILTYDQLFKMDEILVNTFYTYCFMDPEINIIKDGNPEIVHPDILEKKLNDVKEMINYIYVYRNQAKKELSTNQNP